MSAAAVHRKDVTGRRPHRQCLQCLRPGASVRRRDAMKRLVAMHRPRVAKLLHNARPVATKPHAAMRRRGRHGRQQPAAPPLPKATACPSA